MSALPVIFGWYSVSSNSSARACTAPVIFSCSTCCLKASNAASLAAISAFTALIDSAWNGWLAMNALASSSDNPLRSLALMPLLFMLSSSARRVSASCALAATIASINASPCCLYCSPYFAFTCRSNSLILSRFPIFCPSVRNRVRVSDRTALSFSVNASPVIGFGVSSPSICSTK